MTEKYCEVGDGLSIAQRVGQVRARIIKAALDAGRDPAEITLVGVTKTRTADEICQLIQAGVDIIGENRVQEMLDKAPALEKWPHKTHLIGHLQRNKVKFLPQHVDMVQSIDSLRLAQALNAACLEHGRVMDVLIEVNIGDEESKSGVSPQALAELAGAVRALPALRLRGLMAIPPFVEGDALRRYFQQMRHLFIDIRAKKMDNDTVNILSMGMSSDFEMAIAEGATMVRVGTGLFGPRQ